MSACSSYSSGVMSSISWKVTVSTSVVTLACPESTRMGSEPGTVKVCVLRGSNLMAMDKGGRSDPYVVVQAAGMVPATPKKVKTSAKKGTVNPEWGETLELNVPEAPCPLHLEVFDHDNVGRDDAMGNALLLPAQCANIHAKTAMTLELSTQGTIEVEVTWERSVALPAATPAASTKP